jgi:TRAP transporter TAXI family solute receptor
MAHVSQRLRGTLPALFATWGLLALVVVVGFAVAYRYVGAPPPTHVRIATGSPEGAYYRFAREYSRILAEDGITLEVVPTAGSIENLSRLASGDVTLALVQGGCASEADRDALQSLGGLFPEPVWAFTRAGVAIDRLSDLKHDRVAVGAPGSGTEVLAAQILAANGVTPDTATFVRTGPVQSVHALLNGTVDAALFVASPDATFVRHLLGAPEAALLALDRTAAYERRFRYLTSVTLHEGVIDLERDIPQHDTELVATVAYLAAHNDLNVSLIPAVLNAVTRVHRHAGLVDTDHVFPSTEAADLPMNQDAARYIRNGPSFLYRWLPYRTAVWLDRLKVLALPLVALLLPLFRVGPPLYQWRIRSRIYRWYADVRAIDLSLLDDGAVDRTVLLRQLTELERDVASVAVPLAYTGELYHLRLHIQLLRERLHASIDPGSVAMLPAGS